MRVNAVAHRPERRGRSSPRPATPSSILQRRCACGGVAGPGGECAECRSRRLARAARAAAPALAPPIVHEVLRSPGRPLEPDVRTQMERRLGHDFSRVRVHADERAAESARAVGALAYTVGQDVVFDRGRHAPHSAEGQRLLAHELTHAAQQRAVGPPSGRLEIGAAASPEEREAERAAAGSGGPGAVPAAPARVQRVADPYIKRITVDLAPKQSAELTWSGTPPANAPGADSFTVSTGKGYGDPGDPPGTCTRSCCSDPDKQCAPPWNQPGRVGACCTYHGSGYWTGTPEADHGGWKFWTPIQPYYSKRHIALHQHDEVTGQPIGHGCVRMAEENAQRIADFSRGRATSVVMTGRAAPVACDPTRRCGATAGLEVESPETQLAEAAAPVEGLEGEAT